ncbi:uncharacterized protein LOC106093970 [Stomoxys calcitrans]|uniref:Uncharacterized protein n=1 Tax=Stomoxys calcitrans TaxID=35570 RepID=A0A1I8P4U4_STOCA|nr:uncharacterized protein LOC106093970 [Stomoxys calcitrans]
MSLVNLAHHGILVAVVTILMSFVVLQREIATLRYIFVIRNSYDFGLQYILTHVGLFALAVLATLTAALMIWGIVKKYHKLFVPWLILYGVAALLFSFKIWYDICTKYESFEDILLGIIIMGIQIIVFHPIYILFADIRFESQIIPDEMEAMYRPHKYHSYDDFLRKTSL